MIKGKYVATVEVDFSMTEDTPNLLPFDKLQDAVRNGITPNLQIFLEEEVSGLGCIGSRRTASTRHTLMTQ